MSLAPKIDEVNYFATRKNPDLICLTETWLTEAISENCINIPGYYLTCKNRSTGAHGGVCVYINNSIQYKTLDQLHHPELEVLWVHIRPKRLPRGIPCIVTGTVYHPPSADDNIMIDYLSSTHMFIEGLYPGCGIFLTGDFNRLNINRLLAQFSMKQLVRVPTRGDSILDLIITNMPQLYDKDSVERYTPFGLSVHNVIMLYPKKRPPQAIGRRTVRKRVTRRSSKTIELGRYLGSCDWSLLDSPMNCENKLQLFVELVQIGRGNIMPLQTTKLNVNVPPWFTPELKNLIKLRQRAFKNDDKELFRLYRNRVNRERKICRARFFSSKVQHLKESKPSQWCNDVKKIAGMTPATGSDDLCSQLHLDQIDVLDLQGIANLINNALLEPIQEYQPLDSLPPHDEKFVAPVLSQTDVYSVLQNWIFKEFAEILAQPVCSILNSSFAEQRLPPSLEDGRRRSFD